MSLKAPSFVCGCLGLLYLLLPGSARAGGAPQFVCPPVDLAGRPLLGQSDNGTTLFCRYQTAPNDFFCNYFLNNGLLQQDHDNGFCPPVASIGSGPSATPTSTGIATATPTATNASTNTP